MMESPNPQDLPQFQKLCSLKTHISPVKLGKPVVNDENTQEYDNPDQARLQISFQDHLRKCLLIATITLPYTGPTPPNSKPTTHPKPDPLTMPCRDFGNPNPLSLMAPNIHSSRDRKSYRMRVLQVFMYCAERGLGLYWSV